jgi:hypothetical protein
VLLAAPAVATPRARRAPLLRSGGSSAKLGVGPHRSTSVRWAARVLRARLAIHWCQCSARWLPGQLPTAAAHARASTRFNTFANLHYYMYIIFTSNNVDVSCIFSHTRKFFS